jgi:hypothetical protein
MTECPRVLLELLQKIGITPIKVSWASYLVDQI